MKYYRVLSLATKNTILIILNKLFLFVFVYLNKNLLDNK